jgi:hypothetical protein
MNTRTRIAAATAAFCLPFAVMAPANAHKVEINHGADIARVYVDHDSAGVWDKECDSHPVEIQVRSNGGDFQVVDTWRDTNGCEAGGNINNFPNIAEFRLCEINNDEILTRIDCTRWYTA